MIDQTCFLALGLLLGAVVGVFLTDHQWKEELKRRRLIVWNSSLAGFCWRGTKDRIS